MTFEQMGTVSDPAGKVVNVRMTEAEHTLLKAYWLLTMELIAR